MPMVRFIRVAYARPKFGLPPGGLYVPRLLSQKTFVAAMTSQKDGHVEAEPMATLWEKIKAWVNHVGKLRIHISIYYQPGSFAITHSTNLILLELEFKFKASSTNTLQKNIFNLRFIK